MHVSCVMCIPFSISATCCSGTGRTEMAPASFTFSKVVLSADETKQYQLPWEKQQQELSKKRQSSTCTCWCCFCTCLCKPVHNHLRRRVSVEKRAECYEDLMEFNRPTGEQLSLWSNKFDSLIKDEIGRKLFDAFLQQEHSEENLLFWNEVNKMKEIGDTQDCLSKARDIYVEFLKPMAEKEVNVAGMTRRKIEEDLQMDPSPSIYDAAQAQVYNLMHRQSYPRFLASELFRSISEESRAATNSPPEASPKVG